MKKYMIDIETNGSDIDTVDILEVGIVEMELINKRYVPTGRDFHFVMHYPHKPNDSFAIKFMSDLYKRCNETDPSQNYDKLREDVKKYLHRENNDPKLFVGVNISSFDLPILNRLGILEKATHVDVEGGQMLIGDYHYKVLDVRSLTIAIKEVMGIEKNKDFYKLINDIITTPLNTEGVVHTAIFDCYNQIDEINACYELIEYGRDCTRSKKP